MEYTTTSYINPEIFDKFLLRFVNYECPKCGKKRPGLNEILRGAKTDICSKCSYIFPVSDEYDNL